MSDREYIMTGEVVDTYGGDYTYQNTWVVTDKNGNDHYYKEYVGAKPLEPIEPMEITDEKEIADLKYFHQRYRPDGSRI